MYYVYIITSAIYPNKFYVGSTAEVQARLKKHNAGGSIYTKDYIPWELVFTGEFKDKPKALVFEKYLKSHSGRAFMLKRLT